MRNKTIAFVVLILATLFLSTGSYTAEQAAPAAPPTQQAKPALQPQSADQGFDIVLLIDSSGSMKKTDPKDYRKEAARLFISLLGKDDSVGVISFGDSAQTLIPITSNSKDNRSALFGAVNRISSKELSTDITAAIKKGTAELGFSKRKNRAIILMSDGKLDLLDPDKDRASYVELMKLLPDINKAGIKVYSIAFSDQADSRLLGSIAEKTGGLFRYAKADSDIHVMFASIFEKIKSPDSVALKGDHFEIDKDVKEAVLLISKKAGTATMLVDPSGRQISRQKTPDNFQWYGSDVFDMITIKEPVTGAWRVSLSSKEGNRIFVLTDLKLKSSFIASTLNIGDKTIIDAWLEKDNSKIVEKTVLDQVTFAAEITGPDGKNSKISLVAKPAPDAGVYAAEFIADKAGDYLIKIIAEGKTFNRTKDISFNSVEKPAQAVQEEPKPAPASDDSDLEMLLIISAAVIGLLLIIIIFLAIRLRRYKKLHAEALAKAALAEEEKAVMPEPAPVEEIKAAEEPPEEEIKAVVEEPEPVAALKPLDIEALLPAKGETDADRISRLIGIIEFQRGKIFELMMIKDTFQSLKKRLEELRDNSRDLGKNIFALSETHKLTAEMNSLVSATADEIGTIESYITTIEKEEESFSGKLLKWEDQITTLMKSELPPAAEVQVAAADTAAIAGLEEKIKDMAAQLQAKDATIADITKQLEDLDKEYMILYHAAQQGQQP
jgi:Mg-chelatase subunit ChlD